MDEPTAKDCRPPKRCVVCGQEFIPTSARSVACPGLCRRQRKRRRQEEAKAAASGTMPKRAPGKTPQKYDCLFCGVAFQKKRYAGGSTSRQTKYCTRECAFAHKSDKADAAARRRRASEKAAATAEWFLSWGEDIYPLESHCEHCGHGFSRSKAECASAVTPSSLCGECWVVLKDGECRHCGEPCDRKSKYTPNPVCRSCHRKVYNKGRKKYRQKHGQHTNHRRRCRKYGVPYTPISRKKVYDRDRWRCQLCGEMLLRKYTMIDGVVDPLSPTIDHIIPLSLGPGVSPGHVWNNVQAACWECNTRKGADPDFKGD